MDEVTEAVKIDPSEPTVESKSFVLLADCIKVSHWSMQRRRESHFMSVVHTSISIAA
jgi:hypothetical protein